MRIRSLLFMLVAALCAGLPAQPLRAQDAGYTVALPVADTSDAQRDHAFAVALGEVLARTAGQDITQAPGYTDALGSAASLVQDYQYQRAPAGAARAFVLQVTFDPTAVQHLAAGLQRQLHAAAAAAGAIVTQGGTGMLWVSNMHSAMDLARLLSTLRGDAQVDFAEPVGAQGDGVMIHIRTRAPLASVLGDLQAKGHLQPDAVPHAGADASMNWLR